MAGKKFSLFEVILSVICVVFTIEAAAPASAMGNVQFFWWIFLIITFLLPYGLVVAELGTAFDSEGGLYDWVRLGLGDRWGARCSWCYWVNFPLWVASIACMFPSVINAVWGIEFSLGSELPSSLPLCGVSPSWRCSRLPRPIGSWMAALSSKYSLQLW